MYPVSFFALFPAFPRKETAFVAMSFKPQFQSRRDQVIVPGITEVGLEPLIVNASKVSDSILTDILRGIGESRLVLADVSCEDGSYRNGNVMYEVGIAHATRLPEEVVLFRSDNERLPFDITNVRVNDYDPDGNTGSAKTKLKEALRDAIRAIDTTRHLAVNGASEAIDLAGFTLLLDALQKNGIVKYPRLATVEEFLTSTPKITALSRLLELGLLTADYPPVSVDTFAAVANQELRELLAYRITPFGCAVVNQIRERLGVPELLKHPRLAADLDEPRANNPEDAPDTPLK